MPWDFKLQHLDVLKKYFLFGGEFRNLSIIFNEAFCKNSYRLNLLTIFGKSSIKDVWKGHSTGNTSYLYLVSPYIFLRYQIKIFPIRQKQMYLLRKHFSIVSGLWLDWYDNATSDKIKSRLKQRCVRESWNLQRWTTLNQRCLFGR